MRMLLERRAGSALAARATFACPAARKAKSEKRTQYAESGSAEAAGDVCLGGFLVRDAEDLLGGAHLDQATWLAGAGEVEERGVLGDSGGLLHVVGHDDDRV